jgi:hypothetical protein
MWNIAMYDDSMLFVANEIDRFSIGSTTDGLAKNPDGSLTIYPQHTKPHQRSVKQVATCAGRDLQPHDAVLHPVGSGFGQDLQAPRRAQDLTLG